MKKYIYSLLVIGLLCSASLTASQTGTGTNTATATETKTETSTSTSTSTATDTATGTETGVATESKSLIPDNTKMSLDFSADANVMPKDFRGGNPDSELVNCLEDVEYKKQEHTLIYSPNPDDVASGATYAGEPNITWTTSKKDADGNFATVESDNNNMAAKGGSLQVPGEYSIGNSGARQVNEPAKEETEIKDKTGIGSDEASAKAPEEKDPKTVTSNQTMGVVVHDCTAPDVWIAFQEGAGNVDMAATEIELKKKILEKFGTGEARTGRPFAADASAYEEASFLFIDEGESGERNKEPWNKTARVTTAGAMFDENGAVKVNSGVVKSGIKDKNNMTVQVHVEADKDSLLKGVFARRNVPFVVTGVSIDNGDERKGVLDVITRIEKEDGSEVEKEDGAYMFRVANYPRAEYADQPNYFFVSMTKDKDGNLTTVKVPLYIVPSSASFEASVK